MITQVQMSRGDAVQVSWVKSRARPRVGQVVKHETGDWSIDKVYASCDEREVHSQHAAPKTYGSFEDCWT